MYYRIYGQYLPVEPPTWAIIITIINTPTATTTTTTVNSKSYFTTLLPSSFLTYNAMQHKDQTPKKGE